MGSEYNLSNATTTDFTNQVSDFIVEAKALDVANAGNGETYVYYTDATENFGYLLNHPQVSSPIFSLCTWAYSRGWTTDNKQLEQELLHVTGNGKDTFNKVIYNHGVVKLANGDAFCEMVKEGNVLLNMIPISPERVKTVFKGTRIVRYEVWNGDKWVKKRPDQMLHSQNKRIGDSMTGISMIQSGKKVIDTMLEAYADERAIKHRDKALGVVYYKTNNTTKITTANTAIEKGVEDGEMIGLSEGTAEIKPYPSKSSEDRQNWLQYNENLGYQTGGVPRSIATSDGTSEVGGKMGHVIFEPIYTKEQVDMEDDLWTQHAIKIKFSRPPSLGGMQPELDENKNTGMTSIQPNDVTADMERE